MSAGVIAGGLTEQTAGELATARPVRATTAKIASIVRASSVAVAVPSGVIGVSPPVSLEWLVPAATVLTGWTAVYTWFSWTQGLRPWVIAVDVMIVSVLGFGSGRLVGDPVLATGWGWVTQVASMVAVCAQLAGTPVLSIPAGLVVAGSVATGLYTAGAPPAIVANIGITVATQAAVAAVVMAVAQYAGRAAADAYARLEQTRRDAQVALAGRTDELSQFRLLHNGPLTTLSMALNAHDSVSPDLLRRRASSDLAALPSLATAADGQDTSDRLDERLAQVTLWYLPTLTITAALPLCSVPKKVADAFADAASESLENVVRHAAVDRADVTLEESSGVVRVEIADHGKGFDPDQTPLQRFGLRRAVLGGIGAVGGRATIWSARGQGSRIVLEWRRE